MQFNMGIIRAKVAHRLIRFGLVRRVRLKCFGRAFYCRALQGESDYDICINSDMTVSCNCMDYDGSGHIGDLRTHSLNEIFHGEKADGFRRSLARGDFPVQFCPDCRDLRSAGTVEIEKRLRNYHVPTKGIMAENTVACDLDCLECNRDLVLSTRSRASLTLEDIQIVAETLRDNGIQKVSFFNLGEPFMSNTVYEELKAIRSLNPDIEIATSTNGRYLSGPGKMDAALLTDHVFFSIDGCSQETCEHYQRGVDFSRAINNMGALVQHRNAKGLRRPIIEWKYVVFRWNDREEHIEEAIRLARSLNIDVLSFWPAWGNRRIQSRRFKRSRYFRQLGRDIGEAKVIEIRGNSGNASLGD